MKKNKEQVIAISNENPPIQLAPEIHTKTQRKKRAQRGNKGFCLKSKHELHDGIAYKNHFSPLCVLLTFVIFV
jgi:hypothetical protein